MTKPKIDFTDEFVEVKPKWMFVELANGRKKWQLVRREPSICVEKPKWAYFNTRGNPVRPIRHSCKKNAVGVDSRGWVCGVCHVQITGD